MTQWTKNTITAQKHKHLACRSFLKGLILFAGVVVLTVQTPFVTEIPASAPATVQLAKLNVGMTSAEVVATLPRDETLYFNGQQWDSVVGWNPYSSNMNNALAIAQQDNARVTVWETPYIYNMLDGKQYPLLADGPQSWNVDMTGITFKIKPAAHNRPSKIGNRS